MELLPKERSFESSSSPKVASSPVPWISTNLIESVMTMFMSTSAAESST